MRQLSGWLFYGRCVMRRAGFFLAALGRLSPPSSSIVAGSIQSACGACAPSLFNFLRGRRVGGPKTASWQKILTIKPHLGDDEPQSLAASRLAGHCGQRSPRVLDMGPLAGPCRRRLIQSSTATATFRLRCWRALRRWSAAALLERWVTTFRARLRSSGPRAAVTSPRPTALSRPAWHTVRISHLERSRPYRRPSSYRLSNRMRSPPLHRCSV